MPKIALSAGIFILAASSLQPAQAFQFADGSRAVCRTRNGVVLDLAAPPGHEIYRTTYTGMTLPTPEGTRIFWNMARLDALPDEVHDFLYFHECAHARVPTSDELTANCEGLKDMRRAGRAGRVVERELRAYHASLGDMGPRYGEGGDYWDRTLRCAAATEEEGSCQRAYAACTSNIQSPEECVQGGPQRCVEICTERYDYSRARCMAQLCQPTPTNIAGWQSRCRSRLREQREACEDARAECRRK